MKPPPQFGLCRDCKHWLATSKTRESLENYSRSIHPDDGWVEGVCARMNSGIRIAVSAGDWVVAAVDSIKTDANFGCRLFEV